MAVYKPSELRSLLSQWKLAPKKSLSQNFLIDGNIIRKIAAAAEAEQGDIILEIGPGPGALTEELLERETQIVAVEKDRFLATHLQRLDPEGKQLQIYSEDIMQFDFESVLKPLCKKKKAKVVANLPYQLTTPILTLLLPQWELFSSITVMVQKEVALRMSAEPKTCDYSSLTLFLRYHSIPRYAFTVSRNCFYPVPNVDSAVVSLQLIQKPVLQDETGFFQLVRSAFQQRRKMLKSSLKARYSADLIEQSLLSIGQNPQARPEELSLNEFLELFRIIQN